MRLLMGHDAAVGKFVEDLAPIERPEWPLGFVGFGILRADGALVAGVVFSEWHPAAKRIQLSAAALDPRSFGPRILVSLGNYAFGQLGCFRVWARTSTENQRARKFLKGIGFTEESTQAHWYGPKRHAITLRVTEPEWRQRWGISEVKKAA